jgi:ribonuclease HI
MNLIIHTDGGSRGNPGPAAAGVVIRDADSDEIIHEAGYFLGKATNNVAEYQGLIRALEYAQELGATRVQVYTDSELMVKQITGEYRVKSPDLKPLAQKAQSIFLTINLWHIQHVRREKNTRADAWANKAMDAGQDVIQGQGTGSAPEVANESVGVKSTADRVYWTVQLLKKPPKKCPASCRAKTAYHFGPGTPEGFCIHAAEAVFGEDPTLWPTVDKADSQTHCPRCNVPILIELK